MPKKKVKTRHYDDRIVLENCRQFLDRERPGDISQRFGNMGIKVTRETVYPLVGEAIDRDYFFLMAPLHLRFTEDLSAFYGNESRQIRVVNAPDASTREYVCRDAARLIADMIMELGKKKERVHLGLGGGYTVRQVVSELVRLLRNQALLPALAVHVVSSGFSVVKPNSAPITFLALFENIPADIRYFGLFAPPAVKTEDYADVKRLAGVAESFAAAREIDILITSIASAEDEDGALNQFAAVHKKGFKRSALKREKWVGDLQYLPYSEKGPIHVDVGKRAVTLLEWSRLKRSVEQDGTQVVVVAPPCATCNRPKTDALWPLLARKSLAVWTHMVMDTQTAQELMVARA